MYTSIAVTALVVQNICSQRLIKNVVKNFPEIYHVINVQGTSQTSHNNYMCSIKIGDKTRGYNKKAIILFTFLEHLD